jgi:hypothetical protein
MGCCHGNGISAFYRVSPLPPKETINYILQYTPMHYTCNIPIHYVPAIYTYLQYRPALFLYF